MPYFIFCSLRLIEFSVWFALSLSKGEIIIVIREMIIRPSTSSGRRKGFLLRLFSMRLAGGVYSEVIKQGTLQTCPELIESGFMCTEKYCNNIRTQVQD